MSEVAATFKQYQTGLKFFKGKKIKALKSDNGGEYISKEFEKHLRDKGILHRKTVPYSQQQIGNAEKLNQTLMNMTGYMLFGVGLPQKFWAEALSAANYIRNKCPSRAINDQITFQLCVGRDTGKWETSSRADECVFLGFQEGIKGYRLWRLSDKKIVVSRGMHFYKHVFPFKTPCPAKPSLHEQGHVVEIPTAEERSENE
ncbi:hypothetical protein PR048_025679 [Dryococelus australis]|uniref:Integrase catalytic domain-containing protein n=1 Tax=Dryococelus australis TaxID=614101 RepID=A0ABQ9GJ91_9NEOP|nr:hypothetical protein PR048_025679 [Dryococelus australis]